LQGSQYVTTRPSPPIELEDNNSTTLLVFQSPGDVEWDVGHAIEDHNLKGRSCGAKVARSWSRKKRTRSEFDIVNVVQCYQGKNLNTSKDEAIPKPIVRTCSARLEAALKRKKYVEAIGFGVHANRSLRTIINALPVQPVHIQVDHPNSSGFQNAYLDKLW
jgi:hypothetical protein